MKDIKLYYFKKKLGNFGDELNTYIPKKLFNINSVFTPFNDCEALFIGSILDTLCIDITLNNSSSILVWGSGFIKNTNKYNKLYRPLNIKALRGKYTKNCLERLMNIDLSSTTLGDPGLLLSECFKGLNIQKKYKYGIIPHYIDKNSENLKKIQLENIHFIDIQASIETVVKEILQCEYILSSAMHGLIAADSFGIPNRRLIISNKIVGGNFKYDDYYSAFEIEQPEPIDLQKIDLLDKISFDYTIKKEKVKEIQQNLIRSFPYNAKN